MESKYQILTGANIAGKGTPFIFITANDFEIATPFIIEHFILIVNLISNDQPLDLIGQVVAIHNHSAIPREDIEIEKLLKEEIRVAEAHLQNHLYSSMGERALVYKADLTKYEGFILTKLCLANQNVQDKIQEILKRTSCNNLKNELSRFLISSARIEIKEI